MKIDCGKYIVQSDKFPNVWIEEKYIGKDKDGNDKESVRRITGYMKTFNQALEDFMNTKFYGDESDSVEDVMNNLIKYENDIKEIVEKYYK